MPSPQPQSIVPVIIGSDKDLSHAKKIVRKLSTLGVRGDIRISSAHKATRKTLDIISAYLKNDRVYTFITCAGKSNALSAVVDSKSFKPVIACPPLKHESMYDLYSSTSMPSDVAPMVVLKPENAALAAAKICALHCPQVAQNIRRLLQENTTKLHLADVRIYTQQQSVDLESVVENTQQTPTIQQFEQAGVFRFQRLGKVRDVYSGDSEMILAASDRLSSFDRVITSIPYKGTILNDISTWWFKKTQSLVPNHLLDSSGRFMRVQKCTVIPIEFVIRSYLTGSTNTSIWKNYANGSRTYCGHKLADGMVRNQPLPTPLLTPTTKSEHDELISKDEILSRGIMTPEQWDTCEQYAHRLFAYGQIIAAEKGLILVDTKYEFGINSEGQILLIDELHTPDSSRYWIQHSYAQRFEARQEPDIIDKDIIRKWLKKQYTNPYDESVELTVPDSKRVETARKYMELYELLTGTTFIPTQA